MRWFMMMGLCMAASLAAFGGTAEKVRFAAPEALGKGDGSTAENAMAFKSAALWKTVQNELRQQPVTVQLAAGNYFTRWPSDPASRIDLVRIGDEKHLLTIKGAPELKSVFARHPEDSREVTLKNFPTLIRLRECRNVLLEGLYFTGDGVCGSGIHILSGSDIIIRNCHWKDMRGAYYSASGANAHGSKPGARNISWLDCTFENVGINSHAHMLYNANSCSNLTIRNCKFKDAYGDYIRFRNRIDGITIEECEFIDTGKYDRSPFIFLPLFIDFEQPEHYEYFSENVTIRNNRFTYEKPGPRSWMLAFHISGYNPPGREYLFSKSDLAKADAMSDREVRAFIGKRFGINLDRVRIENNRLTGCADLIMYESWPNYGSEKRFPPAEYRNTFSLTRAFQAQ